MGWPQRQGRAQAGVGTPTDGSRMPMLTSELQGAIEEQTGLNRHVKIDSVGYTSRVSRFKLTPKSRCGPTSAWERSHSHDARMKRFR